MVEDHGKMLWNIQMLIGQNALIVECLWIFCLCFFFFFLQRGGGGGAEGGWEGFMLSIKLFVHMSVYMDLHQFK